MAGVNGQGQVFRHRAAVIDAAHQGHGRPEQLHLFEVRPPVADAIVEHRPDQRIGPHPVVEAVDEAGDHGLVDAGLRLDAADGGQAAGFKIVGRQGHGP
jgi:hypothetical protein